jgi:hypothetical protein
MMFGYFTLWMFWPSFVPVEPWCLIEMDCRCVLLFRPVCMVILGQMILVDKLWIGGFVVDWLFGLCGENFFKKFKI